jgi:hypothetical protein
MAILLQCVYGIGYCYVYVHLGLQYTRYLMRIQCVYLMHDTYLNRLTKCINHTNAYTMQTTADLHNNTNKHASTYKYCVGL